MVIWLVAFLPLIILRVTCLLLLKEKKRWQIIFAKNKTYEVR